jgi:hypothetical protein
VSGVFVPLRSQTGGVQCHKVAETLEARWRHGARHAQGTVRGRLVCATGVVQAICDTRNSKSSRLGTTSERLGNASVIDAREPRPAGTLSERLVVKVGAMTRLRDAWRDAFGVPRDAWRDARCDGSRDASSGH